MTLRYAGLLLLLFAAPHTAWAQQPDFTISATAEDASGEAGDRVTLDYTATNLNGGDEEEFEDIPVGFYFSTDQTLSDDDAFSEREEVDLEEGEPEEDNEQIDIPESLDAGDYFILVVIDDVDAFDETDETNNTEAIPFTVTGGGGGGGGAADLTISSLSADPSSADPGDEVEVSYTLANTGDEQAGESQIAFYFSTDQNLSSNDVLAERVEADEVDAGDSGDEDEDITVPASLDAGDYFLLAVADARNAVTETTENNNTEALPFTVGEGGGGGGGTADLEVTSASADPTSADPGDEVEVSYTLANTGDEQAGESQVGLYFSTDRFLSANDVLATREDADEVDAGDSDDGDIEINVPASLDAGDYFLLVVADDRNAVTESDEGNNVFDLAFTVGEGGGGGGGTADLDITDASVTPSTAAPGEDVQVDYTLENEGDEQAGESQLAFYFSEDQNLSSSDVLAASVAVDEVDAGDSTDDEETITVPSSLTAGEYFLLVVADDANEVTESDENNNTLAVPFSVTPGTANEEESASAFRLGTPAPNPTAGRTTLHYTLAETGLVRLVVYDVLGRRVALLVEEVQSAGPQRATWNLADDLTAGVYVFRLETAEGARTQQVTVVR